MRPGKIISGGQTGVDRAALDFAIERGIPWGGWAPKGWRSEDGGIPERYREHMREVESADYRYRTKMNVDESSATLVCAYAGRLSPGTMMTLKIARARERSLGSKVVSFCAVVDLGDWGENAPAIQLRRRIQRVDLSVLNIAGPRESKAPGIYAATLALLREVWP